MTTESIDLLLVAVKLSRMHNYGVYLNLSVTTIVYVVPAAVLTIRRKLQGSPGHKLLLSVAPVINGIFIIIYLF